MRCERHLGITNPMNHLRISLSTHDSSLHLGSPGSPEHKPQACHLGALNVPSPLWKSFARTGIMELLVFFPSTACKLCDLWKWLEPL